MLLLLGGLLRGCATVARKILLLTPPSLLLLAPLTLLLADGLHHAHILCARDATPTRCLHGYRCRVHAPHLAVARKILPRNEAPHAVLEHSGAAAEELGAHAFHVVYHLAFEQHHSAA